MLLNLASRLDDSDDDHDALNSSRATIKNLRPPSVKVHDMSRNESVLISSSCKQKIKMNKSFIKKNFRTSQFDELFQNCHFT